ESLSTVGKSIIDIIPIPDILTSKIPLLITNRAEDTVKGVLIMSLVDYKKKPESPASTREDLDMSVEVYPQYLGIGWCDWVCLKLRLDCEDIPIAVRVRTHSNHGCLSSSPSSPDVGFRYTAHLPQTGIHTWLYA
ncbi:hypothetical protein Tco_0688322, partial [Tanacetum coccineum]